MFKKPRQEYTAEFEELAMKRVKLGSPWVRSPVMSGCSGRRCVPRWRSASVATGRGSVAGRRIGSV